MAASGFRVCGLLLGLIALQFCICTVAADDHHVVGYYTSWSIYARNYHVPDIPADSVTEINYAFANIANGEIVLGDYYADVDRFYPGDSWDPDSLRGCFHQLQILKRAHPHLRTLISVGGWTWSGQFSDVALTPTSRARFAASCVDFVQRYDFDGVDIDWEYPVEGGLPGNIHRPEDKENFTLLLQEMRRQLDEAGSYLLTAAVTGSPLMIDNLEVENICAVLDWINVMTYDYHGPWGGDADVVTHFNAPIDVASDDPLPEPYRAAFNVSAAIQAYVDAGALRGKLHPGLAFYGRGYGGVTGGAPGLFASYWGPSDCGTWESGVFDYWDLVAHYIGQSGYATYRHPEAAVPWLCNSSRQIMISYDDGLSIREKAVFARTHGLGGVMFWEFSGDRGAGLLSAAVAGLADSSFAGIATPSRPDDLESARSVHISPNPAPGAIRIDLAAQRPGRLNRLHVAIYDARGALVKVICDNVATVRRTGWVWDGRDSRGFDVPQGTYFCTLDMGLRRETRTVVLIR